MSKTSLCEMLGVRPKEKWEYDGLTFAVDEDGFISQYKPIVDGKYVIAIEPTSSMLCAIIAEPEKIVHKVCWTKRDIEGAKFIRKEYPNAVWVHRDNEEEISIGLEDKLWCKVTSSLLVPSLKIGALVDLDEILRSEKKNSSQEESRWTEKDYSDAIWVDFTYPPVKWVHRCENEVQGWVPWAVHYIEIPSSRFPSLKVGESVSLKEILGM